MTCNSEWSYYSATTSNHINCYASPTKWNGLCAKCAATVGQKGAIILLHEVPGRFTHANKRPARDSLSVDEQPTDVRDHVLIVLPLSR